MSKCNHESIKYLLIDACEVEDGAMVKNLLHNLRLLCCLLNPKARLNYRRCDSDIAGDYADGIITKTMNRVVGTHGSARQYQENPASKLCLTCISNACP